MPVDLCVLYARRECIKRILRTSFLLAVMVVLGWWLFNAASENYRWQWYRVWRFVGVWEDGVFKPGSLLVALGMTLRLTSVSLVLAMAVGGALAFMKISISPAARMISTLAIGLLRNTPLLMQLFLGYFVIAPALGLEPFWSAVLSLSLFEGAFLAEIFRAGVLSVPYGQWEAALSLGMPMFMTARMVIVPQALRRVLPALSGQLISLIKDTSLVSAIAVADLTMRARVVITDTFLSFEIWLLVAFVYLVLTSLVSLTSTFFEHREHV